MYYHLPKPGGECTRYLVAPLYREHTLKALQEDGYLLNKKARESSRESDKNREALSECKGSGL